jgi:hypothetical protein
MRRGTRRALVVAAALALLATGCTDDVTPASSGALGKGKIAQLDAAAIPATIGGLAVTREDLGARIEQIDKSYAEAAALYGLRTPDQTLQATLQVTRLTAKSRFKDPKFLAELRGKIGSGVNVTTHLGDQVVYLQSGTNQRLAIWSRDRYLFVLATRNDYGRSRTLLRTALDLQPTA